MRAPWPTGRPLHRTDPLRRVHGLDPPRPAPACILRAGGPRGAGVAGLGTAPVAGRLRRGSRRGRCGRDRVRRVPGQRGSPRPDPVRAAAGVRPGRPGTDPAGGGERRHRQGHARGVGTAGRDPAAAGLRADHANHPHRRDPVARPPGTPAPPGIQRGGARAQLPGRLGRLPPAGRRRHRDRGPGPARLRLDDGRGGQWRDPAGGELGPRADRGQGRRPGHPGP